MKIKIGFKFRFTYSNDLECDRLQCREQTAADCDKTSVYIIVKHSCNRVAQLLKQRMENKCGKILSFPV